MRLIPDSPVSLYVQLKEILINRINDGTYPAGSFIPSESKLISEFGVSITTVRKTVNELASIGLVEKIHGKGSRVISREVRMDISSLHSMSEAADRAGLTQKRDIVEFNLSRDYPGHLAKLFNLKQPDRVYSFKKVNLINGIPSALIICYYPEYLGINTDKDELLKLAIYDIFEKNGYEISREEWKLSADNMGAGEAGLLAIGNNTPVIVLDVVYYDRDFRTVMFSREYWRSDKFHISISLNKIPENRDR
jgi:GntR family transcriptional regulator